uniref:non-specific serine/threonine protein kinase n=1 Tax=Anopheles stephensi TaxID=30069 RepID=A0A182Y841_ANOST
MELKEIHRTYPRNPNPEQSVASDDLSVLSRFQNLSLFVENPTHNVTSDALTRGTSVDANSSSNSKTQQQHALDLTGYRKIRSVGQGSFGTAILYERQSDGQQVVMKQIALSNLAKPEREMAMNEVDVFSKLHHPNIIAYLGSSVRGDLLLIEMEYADGGTLAQMLAERNQSEPLPERFVLNIFEQLTSAISYMHSQNILHRDLKTANVFLHGKGTVKVGDFGISKIMNTNVHAQTVLGTPYYFSPEMCEGKEYNEKSDVWALGCIVGEMCCLKKAFTATNLSELVGKIMTAEYVPLPACYSESLRHVLGLMFQIDPNARPSASELLQYWVPFIYRNLGSSDGAAVGDGYTIFCTASGTLLACGDNSNGCLGQGNKTSLLVPKKIEKLEHIPIVQVASGTTHVLALTEGGIVYSWGTSSNGALALGKRIHVALEPERVILPQLVQNVREVYAGPDCTILFTRQGDCYCCGSNAGNRLGLGRKVSGTATLRKIQLDANRPKIVAVSVADTHAAFLIEGGFLITLGDNASGQRGVGHKCELLQPTIVRQLQARYVLNVKCSQTYTVATTDDNCVVLWGTRLGTPESCDDSSGSHGRNNNDQVI